MADIPLDLQRRFERRWAARFVRAAAPKKQELERQDRQLTEPGRAKEKPTGLSRWASDLHQQCKRGVEAPRPCCQRRPYDYGLVNSAVR